MDAIMAEVVRRGFLDNRVHAKSSFRADWSGQRACCHSRWVDPDKVILVAGFKEWHALAHKRVKEDVPRLGVGCAPSQRRRTRNPGRCRQPSAQQAHLSAKGSEPKTLRWPVSLLVIDVQPGESGYQAGDGRPTWRPQVEPSSKAQPSLMEVGEQSGDSASASRPGAVRYPQALARRSARTFPFTLCRLPCRSWAGDCRRYRRCRARLLQ